MMNSLFESFDPLMSLFSLNFIVLLLPVVMPISLNFWYSSNRQKTSLNNMSLFMTSELSASLNNQNNKMNVLWLISTFLLILIFNITGLLPYVYTITSQMLFTLSLALPFWMGFVLFSFFFNTTHLLSHMVPLSTPLALSQFMTLIETISQIIRPITLSVRLCANMTAGHILMGLTSGPIFMFTAFSSVLLILLMLETAVAFIQSYVFVMLISMYLSETS